MIGRPVTRELLAGPDAIRIAARDVRKARAVLDGADEYVRADVSDPESLRRALDGADAVYTSLANPMRSTRPAWDPDYDGTLAIIEAAKAAGVSHVLRLSAMAVEEGADDWWAARAKLEADQAVQESGLTWTIFRPTWFMESIAASTFGPHLFMMGGPKDRKLYFLAGSDFGRLVEKSLDAPEARNATIDVQGPEALALGEAFSRFWRHWRGYFLPTPVPTPLRMLAGAVLPPVDYLNQLMKLTFEHAAFKSGRTEANAIHDPTINIDEYARDLRHARDYPQKLPIAGA